MLEMMKNTSRGFTVVLLAVVLTLSAASVATAPRAEVSAEVDPHGNVIRMLVLTRVAVGHTLIWTVGPVQDGHEPLNPLGDFNHDLWPVYVQDPQNGNKPWVVWSRFNGVGYDLAWSTWDQSGWKDIQWLQELPTTGNDVDPDLALNDSGRPYVAWWSDEGGFGKVYFSLFLETRWMTQFQISADGVDSRYPEMTINEDGSVTIGFETPNGQEFRTILFNDGVGIVDDAEPTNTFTVESFGR
jgi:hypothetical protein